MKIKKIFVPCQKRWHNLQKKLQRIEKFENSKVPYHITDISFQTPTTGLWKLKGHQTWVASTHARFFCITQCEMLEENKEQTTQNEILTTGRQCAKSSFSWKQPYFSGKLSTAVAERSLRDRGRKIAPPLQSSFSGSLHAPIAYRSHNRKISLRERQSLWKKHLTGIRKLGEKKIFAWIETQLKLSLLNRPKFRMIHSDPDLTSLFTLYPVRIQDLRYPINLGKVKKWPYRCSMTFLRQYRMNLFDQPRILLH